jgi:pimeloyl-ACP methyl ester carboxylesterase
MRIPYFLHRPLLAKGMTWIVTGISLLAFSCVILLPQSASAQNEGKGDEKEIAKERRITMKTKDGVQLSAWFLEGNLKKESMPVIMLHDWKGSGGAMSPLAKRIQKEGHTVLAPDLRGHGKSTILVIRKPNGQTDTRQLNPDKFTRNHILAMNEDVETCKRFLMERHNAGECNIEKLCVVGAGMGGLVALNWAATDWSAPSTRFLKQGQDVKTLILISPPQSFKGLTNQAALAQPVVRGGLNTLLVVGNENSTALSNVKRLYNRMERYHGTRPNDAAALKDHRLFLVELETASQGSSMLREKNLRPNPNEVIWTFLRSKIVSRETLTIAGTDFILEWKRRGNIFEENP